MDTKNKSIAIGQKVWVKPGYPTKSEPVEAIITKVGKKYFELDDNSREKFDINTLQQVNDINYKSKIYLSFQNILDEKEHLKLSGALRTDFGNYGSLKYSLEQLRKIAEIVNLKL